MQHYFKMRLDVKKLMALCCLLAMTSNFAVLADNQASREMSFKMYDACERGTPNDVLALLRSGVPANGVDSDKHPYLFAAILNERHGAEIVRLLLHHGATVDIHSEFRETPLLSAIESRRRDIVDILVKYGAKYDLESTCSGGNWQMLKKYLDSGTSPNACIDGEPLLQLAENNPWYAEELVPNLIRRGAKVNAVDSNGETALNDAIGDYPTFDLKIVEILLRSGADVNKPDDVGSPLMNATSSRHASVLVPLLIKHHANVRWADKDGCQAIHMAAHADFKIFKILIADGADMNARTNDGETPLFWALDADNIEVVDYIMNHGESVTKLDSAGVPLWMCTHARPDLLEFLKKRGVDLNQTSSTGKNAIQVAIDNKRWSEISALVAVGIDVNHIAANGQTAYAMAIARPHIDQVTLVPILVAAGEKDAVPLPKPTERLALDGSDEMAIARFMLTRAAAHDHPRVFVTDAIVLADDRMTADLGPSLAKRPGTPPDLVKAVDNPAPDQHNIFAPIDDIDGILCARGDEIGKSPTKRWVDFYKANPNSDGYFAMSMPVLDTSHTIAVVYFLDMLQGTGSHGETYILRKTNGEWNIQDTLGGFIS